MMLSSEIERFDEKVRQLIGPPRVTPVAARIHLASRYDCLANFTESCT